MIRCDWPLPSPPLSIGDCNHLTNGNVLLQMHLLVEAGFGGSHRTTSNLNSKHTEVVSHALTASLKFVFHLGWKI